MTATMMLVATSATKRIVLAREDIIEKFFFLVDVLIDFEHVRSFRLPDMAPEEPLLIAFELDSGARCRLELDHLADFQVRNFAESQQALFENRGQGDFGLLDFGGD